VTRRIAKLLRALLGLNRIIPPLARLLARNQSAAQFAQSLLLPATRIAKAVGGRPGRTKLPALLCPLLAWSRASGVLVALLTCSTTPARADPPRVEPGDSISQVPDDRRSAVDSASDLADLSMAREKDSSRAALSNLRPEEIAELLQRYAREPSAIVVARAAIRASERDPDRFASMLRRARWRGLVPALSLGARRGQGVDLRTTVTDDEGVRFTSGDDLVVSATLRFELGRLLFADEEVMIAREARAAKAVQLELVRDVIHWYYLRRRLQLERDALGHTSVLREIKIAEIEALLDAFTNGFFGRMIGSQRNE
jgi:hypothetical protein